MSRMSRHENKPHKKVTGQNMSIAQTIAKFLLLILILSTAFFMYEYKKGARTAQHDDKIETLPPVAFNGEKSPKGGLNVLLLGSDSRGSDLGRADTIVLARYDQKSRTPKMVSFMRDLFVEIPGYGWNKLNAAYAYGGPELVRETLKLNFGVTSQYYVVMSFESFPKIVDTLLTNGLKINVEKDIEVDGIELKQGNQQLTGEEALAYARFRMDEEGDFGRVRRQQQVLTAMMHQGLSFKNIAHVPETIGMAQGYASTNLKANVYPTIVKDFILSKNKSLEKLSVPVEGSFSFQDYDDIGSVVEFNQEQNLQALDDFL
ncbi:LCP family protein [Vagococcus lutrae]|uniref:LCP family protein n=1 Tax=Vagococcus lutrae TaxID=81947 RepID=UPI001443F02D|nr:LCP family protein [Vagococcus lutrae]NKZ27866.1 LCP family protein [Vagococcus lutrae]